MACLSYQLSSESPDFELKKVHRIIIMQNVCSSISLTPQQNSLCFIGTGEAHAINKQAESSSKTHNGLLAQLGLSVIGDKVGKGLELLLTAQKQSNSHRRFKKTGGHS